jgi:transposase
MHVRGRENMLKRLLVHAGASNLGLWLRTLFGIGTPRGLQGRLAALGAMLSALWSLTYEAIAPISSQTDRPGRAVRLVNPSIACD